MGYLNRDSINEYVKKFYEKNCLSQHFFQFILLFYDGHYLYYIDIDVMAEVIVYS